MKRLKPTALTIITALALTLAPAGLLAGSALAATCRGVTNNSSQDQVLQGIGETGSNCNDSQVNNTFAAIVNILSLIVGVIAVVAIIWGGLKYITAAGDTNKIGNAKSTIVGALIGLIIVSLAQVLVHFVLFHTGKAIR